MSQLVLTHPRSRVKKGNFFLNDLPRPLSYFECPFSPTLHLISSVQHLKANSSCRLVSYS